MKKHEFCIIILRMLGIYAIIRSIPMVQHLSFLFSMDTNHIHELQKPLWFYVGNVAPSFLYVCVIILLLVRSNSIARLIIKDDGVTTFASSLSSKELQAISFSVMAIVIFLLGLPSLSNFTIFLWELSSRHFNNQEVEALLIRGTWRTGISVVIQYGLAVYLFFGSKGLANFCHRIQIASYVKINDVETNDGPNKEK